MTRRRKRRAVIRIPLKILKWLIIAVLALVLLTYGFLQTGPGHRLVRSIAIEQVNKVIAGRLTVLGVEALTINRVRLDGVTLYDPSGRKVASIESVIVEYDLAAMIRGHIEITNVIVVEPAIRMETDDEGNLTLLAAIAPASPPDPDEEEEEEPSSGPGTRVTVAQLTVSGGSLQTNMPNVPQLGFHDLSIRGRLRIRDQIAVDVDQLGLTLTGPDGPLLRLDPLTVRLRTGQESVTEANLQILGEHDRVRANVSIRGLGGDGGVEDLVIDARLRFDRLTNEILGQIGMAELKDQTPGWVSGEITAQGTLGDLTFRADLETPGGALALSGGFRSPFDADLSVETPGLELAAVSSALPEMAVGVDVDVAMRPGEAEGERRFEVELTRASLDNQRLPGVSLAAVLGPEAVDLERLRLPVLGDRLRVSGRFQFPVSGTEGADDDEPAEIDADIELDDIDLDELPELDAYADFLGDAEGTIDLDYDVHVVLEDEPRLRTDGTLAVRNFRLDDIVATSVDVEGSVRGRLTSPRVDLDVRARRVGNADVTIQSADVGVAGGPTDYTLVGRIALADGPRTSIDLDVGWEDERVSATGSLLVMQDGETLEASFNDVAYSLSGLIEAGRLRLRHPQIDVLVRGRVDLEGDSDAEVEITRLDLGVFDGRLFLPDLPIDGIVTGQLQLAGRLDDPRGRVDIRWNDGQAGPAEDISAFVRLDYEPTGLTTTGRIEIGDQLSVSIDGTADFATRAPPAEAIANADLDVQVDLDADDLSLLRSIAPDAPVQGGGIEGSVSWRGSLDAPNVNAELTATQLMVEGAPTIDFWTLTSLDDSGISTALDVWDANGRLVRLRGSAALDWDDLTSDDPVARLEDAYAELEAEVPRRPVDTLPLELGPLEELGLEVALQATLTREPGMLPMGEVHLQLESDAPAPPPPAEPRVASPEAGEPEEWEEQEAVEVAVNEVEPDPCADQRAVALRLDAVLQDGESSIITTLNLGESRPLSWEIISQTPFSQWVDSGDVDTLPAVTSQLIINQLDLKHLPLVCEQASGVVAGEVNARGLLTDTPLANLDLRVTGLELGDAVPIAFNATASLDDSDLDVELGLAEGGRTAVTVTAHAPVVWGGEQYAPALREEPLSASVTLDQFRVAPLSSIVPVFRGQGTLDGSISVEGPVDDLRPNGSLELSDVVLSLPGLDQRLSDVNGRITITPELIRLENLRASDRDGTVRIRGQVTMEGLQPREGTLRITADDFPTRQAGLIVARLTADARAEAEFREERTSVDVVFEELAVRLPETAARSVLSLEPNPDIVFVDQEVVADEAVEADEEPVAAAVPIHIHVDATTPFWVRRSDFALQLTADLRIVADSDGTRISGPVEFRRGFFDLMTKTFDLEEGSITFTGARELDPVLNIVASHELSRYPGETVTARITGRLSEPNLEFETTMPDIETNAEILALLVTGRAGDSGTGNESDSAQDQVASFLGGLTAGLLTMTARNELGDAVPLISVQMGDDVRDVQVRAGFVVDSLVPNFMRDIVTGVYVEGFVGTAEEGQGNETEQVTTGGFLIELYYPNGWITSGTFQPPTNWSLDILWQP